MTNSKSYGSPLAILALAAIMPLVVFLGAFGA